MTFSEQSSQFCVCVFVCVYVHESQCSSVFLSECVYVPIKVIVILLLCYDLVAVTTLAPTQPWSHGSAEVSLKSPLMS